MFDLRIKEEIIKRSWKPTLRFLTKFGININTARSIMSNDVKQIKLKTLYDICFLLQCTPNDLLDIPDKIYDTMPPNHPLRSLKKSNFNDMPSEYLKTMTHEKIDEANAILKKLWQESHQVSEEKEEG